MFGANNKESPPAAPPSIPSTPPVDKVLQMRQQGLSNNQIIQTLQGEGYDSNLIFDALNQADIRGGVEQVPMTGAPMNGTAPPSGDSGFMPPPMDQGLGSSGMSGPDPGASGLDSTSLERIEEVAEAIIDEKWNELVKTINKIIDWKDRTETRLVKLDQAVTTLKSDFDNLTKGVLGKVSEYDQNLTNIGTEIKAMENVFQKVLPKLTENVHTLEKLTRDMKSKKSKS